MKKLKFIGKAATLFLVAFLIMRCSEDPATPVVKSSISGTVTNGSSPADGAVVYIKYDATEATTAYDATTVADATGKYTFSELDDGSYFIFANYDSDNTNNPGGRMAGAIFGGEGGVVAIEGANVTTDIALVSIGQPDAFAVNNFDGGDWSADWNHSVIDFSFPYDGGNATYTGSFLAEEIYVNFDPNALGSSKIEATIDVLTVNTQSSGGRDPLYNSDGTLWTDPDPASETFGQYNLGCIHGYLGMENDNPDSDNRYSTFKSTTIEAYGDGYMATGPFTVNGVTADISMFFRFIPGFQGEDRGGNPTQFSSFQGTFDFAAFKVFGISSGHIGEENDVTIDVSLQVNKAL